MKVGDLVKVRVLRTPDDSGWEGVYWRVGVITSIDEYEDPVVCYNDVDPQTRTFWKKDVEVIHASW